jgi:catechol 2,3-dioxygenase-like lactoylglutathione lyase family enzyme
MFQSKSAFSGFSVKDTAAAKAFYTDKLGLQVDDGEMGMTLHLPNSEATVFVYPKENHEPATFTVLNLVVDDIDAAIDELTAAGVTFQMYDNKDMPQDEKGVLRGLAANMGPDIAWFEDPSGNVMAVLQGEL